MDGETEIKPLKKLTNIPLLVKLFKYNSKNLMEAWI
jgi:hypothetical protein